MRNAMYSAMNTYNASDSVDTVQRLRQEIDKLTREQTEALQTATFVGMTALESKIYDARRQRITELVEQLRVLRGSGK